jgi:hypothetical protein
MAIEKIIDINIQGNADEKVLTLKQQLKAAKAEVIALSDAFGLTSQEAIHAAEKAAELSHEIANANKLVKTFNPSATLNSTTIALGSVKEGFEVAASSLNTFGFESKGLEGTLGKLGVAMELTQGVTAIQESAVAYQNLGATLKSYSIVQKLITAGQWLWNTAIMANPIGAIIVAITALIAAGTALTKYFQDSAEESERNTKAVKNNEKALESQTKTLERNASEFDKKQKQELAMAKASGMSEAAIRGLELKLADEKIAYEKSARAVAFNTYEKNNNYLASLKAAGADDEIIKKQQETTNKSILEYNKQNQNVQKAFDERKDIQNTHLVEVAQSQTNANKKAIEENYKNQKEELEEKLKGDNLSFKQRRELVKNNAFLNKEDRKALLKEISEDEKAQNKKDAEDLKKALENQKNAELAQIDEITKAIGDAQDKQAEKNLSASEVEQRVVKDKYFGLIELAKQQNRSKEEIDALEVQRLSELNDIKDKYRLQDDEKKAAELEKQISDSNASFDSRLEAIDIEQAIYQKQLDDKVITEEQYNEKTKALAKSRTDIAKAEAKAKMDALDSYGGALGSLAGMLGESTAAGKAAAVASATISTYSAANKAYESQLAIPTPDAPIRATIAAGIAIAGGLLNVQKILSVQTPGGAGGGGGSAPGGSAPSMTPPSFNTVGSSSTNQLAQTIGSQAQTPQRSYVVASDVTTAQAMDRNVITNASI